MADLQKAFDEQAGQIEKRRAERAQDRAIDAAYDESPEKGAALVQRLLAEAQRAVAASRKGFAAALAEAQADGAVDDAERERLRALQDAFAEAEALVDKYGERLRGAREGAEEAEEREKERTDGTFYAKAAEAMNGIDVQTRTANATEKIAENTKKTNDLLRKGAGTMVFT